MDNEHLCPLQLPNDQEIIETKTNYFWFEEDILYSISKGHLSGVPDVHETMAVLKQLVGKRKVCFIADTSKTKYHTIEMRDIITRLLPELFKAIALVPCKPVGKIMGSILFMRRKNCPVKIFDTLEAAKDWIEQYRHIPVDAE